MNAAQLRREVRRFLTTGEHDPMGMVGAGSILVAAQRLASCFINLDAVRELVRDVLGCGCPDEVFDDVVIGFPSVHVATPPPPALEMVIGRRLLVTLVPTEVLVDVELEARALLARGRVTRDREGLNRCRLVLVGAVPGGLLEQLQAEAAHLDERTHVHHLNADHLRHTTGVGGARSPNCTPSFTSQRKSRVVAALPRHVTCPRAPAPSRPTAPTRQEGRKASGRVATRAPSHRGRPRPLECDEAFG